MSSADQTKHYAGFQARHMKPGEAVTAVGVGYIGDMMGTGNRRQHNGVLIVTNERVVFYRKGLLGEVFETIPLKAITSIERKSFMGHRSMRFHTSHDALEFKTFEQDSEDALIAAVDAGRHAAASSQQASVPDSFEVLRKLAELRDAGVLSVDEFERKKAELLARV